MISLSTALRDYAPLNCSALGEPFRSAEFWTVTMAYSRELEHWIGPESSAAVSMFRNHMRENWQTSIASFAAAMHDVEMGSADTWAVTDPHTTTQFVRHEMGDGTAIIVPRQNVSSRTARYWLGIRTQRISDAARLQSRHVRDASPSDPAQLLSPWICYPPATVWIHR